MKNTRIRVVSATYTEEQWSEIERDLTLLKPAEFKEKWEFSKEGLRKYLNEHKKGIKYNTSNDMTESQQNAENYLQKCRKNAEKSQQNVGKNTCESTSENTSGFTSISTSEITSESTSGFTSKTLVKSLVKPQVNYLVKVQVDSPAKNRTYVLTDDFAEMLGEQVKALAKMTGWSHKYCIEYIFRNGVKMTDELMRLQREENE